MTRDGYFWSARECANGVVLLIRKVLLVDPWSRAT